MTRTPHEAEIEGVRLDVLRTGMVRNVSAILGSWLIAQGYAEPEMRAAHPPDEEGDALSSFPDRRRRTR